MATITPPLNEEQIARYWRDGHLAGIDILTPEQTSVARERLAKMEAHEIRQDAERWISEDYQPWQEPGSPWWHWFMGMVTHPTMLAAVTQLLGPDIMVRNADIFVKTARASREIRWHTDTTATTEQAGRMLTAWLALTESKLENGCLQWATGSHCVPLPPGEGQALSGSHRTASRSSRANRHPPIQPGQLSCTLPDDSSVGGT